MDNNDYWKKLYGKRTYAYYWLEQGMDAVALITHQLYHMINDGRYETVMVIVEHTTKDCYSVIGIVSKDTLTKANILKIIEHIPSNPMGEQDWRKGR